jgi:hypothetical protein
MFTYIRQQVITERIKELYYIQYFFLYLSRDISFADLNLNILV